MLLGSWIKLGAVIIDVGTNPIDDSSKKLGYRLVGDCDFDSCQPVAGAITAVPGGVGPMTIALLLKNTLASAQRFVEGTFGFRGRVELQVVRPKQGSSHMLFTGAIEVKLMQGILEGHIEQAKKDGFAMWCHNATQQSYEPVWVVLTDLDQVLRVTYDGYNGPGGGARAYVKGMPFAHVHGQL
ncbi:tetrahydrofolate dehydrogenase/cyclohydrolase, putative, partial [Monoraphidium neglectum]